MEDLVPCQNPADEGFYPHQRRAPIATGNRVKVDLLTQIILDMLRSQLETLHILIITELMSRTDILEMVLTVDIPIQVKIQVVKVMGQGHQHTWNILENTREKVITVQVVISSAPQVLRKGDPCLQYPIMGLKVTDIMRVKVNEHSTVHMKELCSPQIDTEWTQTLIYK